MAVVLAGLDPSCLKARHWQPGMLFDLRWTEQSLNELWQLITAVLNKQLQPHYKNIRLHRTRRIISSYLALPPTKLSQWGTVKSDSDAWQDLVKAQAGDYKNSLGQKRYFHGKTYLNWRVVAGKVTPFDGKKAKVEWLMYVDMYSTGRGLIGTKEVKCQLQATFGNVYYVKERKSDYRLKSRFQAKGTARGNTQIKQFFQQIKDEVVARQKMSLRNVLRGGSPQ